MMNNFRYSETSLKRLYTCDYNLITICKLGLKMSPIDITVVCGYRDKDNQDKAFAKGYSRVAWPNSTHNQTPSNAVDLAPYAHGKIKWNDTDGLYLIAGLIIGISVNLGIDIKWGGAWNGTLNIPHLFNDLYHFELIM